MKKRILSIVTALALTMALLPAAVVSAGAATHTVSDSDGFHRALAAAQNGDTIQLTGSFVLKNPQSNNDSLVIDKAVTIQGGSMTLWYAGILLGADVTFKDITLGLGSNVRPAIMANGHTLTLENVQRDPTARHINLFCGGLTGGTQSNLAAARQGSHGQIVIRGNTNLGPTGRIFAGSLSTGSNSNVFDKPATVTIDSSVSGDVIGELYACGALETYTSENDWFDYQNEINPPFASPGNFKVSGTVIFNLYQGKVSKVDGDTGVGGNLAQVNYKGTDFLNDNLVLSSIGGLNVESGSLVPAAGQLVQNNTSTADRTSEIVPVSGGNCFSSANNASLGVAENATLGLQKLGNVTVGNFTGGGSLVLGQSQKLTVTGTVSGTTTVGVGGIFNGHSQAIPTEDFTYIDAASSTETSFTLAAPASRPDFKLVRNENGAWTATKDEQVVIVNDFILPSKVADPSKEITPDPDNSGMPPILWSTSLPFTSVTYAADGASKSLASIQLGIKVNNAQTTCDDDNNLGYCYTTGVLKLYIVGSPGDGEELQIETTNTSALTGSYIIEVTLPAPNSGTGQPITRTATLTIKAADGNTSIPVPAANTGLVYNEQEQIGVPEGPGYTLTGQSNSEAGSHKATATLATGFIWADGSMTAKDIPWSIAKAANLNLPTGLAATAPSAYGKLDGKITGTTAEMQYAKSANFSGATNCTATETTGLQAGDYYVRYKEDTNHNPGPAVMVTVPQGPVTVTSIAISSTDHKTSYQTGEALDVTGLTLAVTMSDGNIYTVPVAAGMVSGFNASSAAQSQTLTVTYGGRTATYTISITGDPVPGGGDSGNTGGGSTGGGSTGGGSTGGGSTGGGSSSNTTTNPDGSVTTTVTDERTGTVTTTTQKPDGSTTVVETKKDGSVTITDTAKSGVKVEAVSKPETDTSARVTLPAGVKTATVTVPVAVTPGTVAVDAKTGQIVRLSAPTEAGMVVRLDGSAELVLEDRSKPFTDIDGHWAESAIDFATAHALFNGTSDTTFAPDASMTRGMVAVVLHNFEGNPDSAFPNGFTDVASDTWYTDAILWITDKGIAGGYGDGSFGTDDHVTREQLVTFLYRYAGAMGYSTQGAADLSTFSDGASVSPYAAEAMGWAVGNGLIVGTDAGGLAPGSGATRAQVAAILNRFVLTLMK